MYKKPVTILNEKSKYRKKSVIHEQIEVVVITFVIKYNSVLSVRCRVSNLNCNCQSVAVLVYIFCQSVFACELTFNQLSVGELLYNIPKHNFLNQNICWEYQK